MIIDTRLPYGFKMPRKILFLETIEQNEVAILIFYDTLIVENSKDSTLCDSLRQTSAIQIS